MQDREGLPSPVPATVSWSMNPSMLRYLHKAAKLTFNLRPSVFEPHYFPEVKLTPKKTNKSEAPDQ